MMIFKRACVVALVAAVAFGWGCGGKKKDEKSDDHTNNKTRIAGKVDLYSGYGASLDRAGLSAKIKSGAVIKIYKYTGAGVEVKTLDGVTPRPVDLDGAFVVENIQTGLANLIVSLETPDGTRLMSAIVPYVPVSGVLNVQISPESNLEALVFNELLKQLPTQKDKKVSPEQIDATFIKKIVKADIFFGHGSDGVTADRIAGAIVPAVLAAMQGFSDDISGSGRPINDSSVVSVISKTREAEMAVELARENLLTGNGNAAEVAKATDRFRASLDDASVSAPSPFSDMPKKGLLRLARTRRELKAAACISGKPDKRCAGQHGGIPGDAGDAVLESLRLEQAVSDLDDRFAIVSGGGEKLSGQAAIIAPAAADATGSAKATGSVLVPRVELKSTSVIADLENLLSLSPDNTAPVLSMLDSARKKLSTDGDEKAVDGARKSLQTLRDYALTGLLGMKYSEVRGLADTVDGKSADLKGKIADPWTPMRDIAAMRNKYFDAVDSALEPLMSHINGKYPKLPEEDRKHIYYDARMLILAAGLQGVPASMFHGADNDGDGVPNDVEAILGSNPDKSDSRPMPVTTKSPESLLPGFVDDVDSDGFPDVIEDMAGTNVKDASSRPDMDTLVFCEEKKMPCKSGKAGEEGTVTLSGRAGFSGDALRGVSVGLFRNLDFRGEPAFAAMAVTDAGGEFSVKAARGDYFVAAYIDVNGDGKPDDRDAAGYLGGAYPRKLTLIGDYALDTDVELIGTIGGPACEEGQVLDPLTRECAASCPAGTSPDPLTGSCHCGRGLVFSITTMTCEQSCPQGTVVEASGLRCGCPKGAVYDKVEKTCACASGLRLDDSSGTCVCEQGYFNPVTGACIESCPRTWVEDTESMSCKCPEGTAKDDISGLCACAGGGLFDESTGKCVASCPNGKVPDAHGRSCVCPENEVEDAGACKCDTGLERDAKSGKCEMPCPLGAERDSKGKCVRVEQNEGKPPAPEVRTIPPRGAPQPPMTPQGAPPGRPDRPAMPGAPGPGYPPNMQQPPDVPPGHVLVPMDEN